jgi:hypothetical protein
LGTLFLFCHVCLEGKPCLIILSNTRSRTRTTAHAHDHRTRHDTQWRNCVGPGSRRKRRRATGICGGTSATCSASMIR